MQLKKLLIIFLAAVAGVTVATAQEALAVLTHGTTTKTFTGYAALQSAYAAASHGDLITLSSGTFGAVNLAKAVTVRGAGMEQDKTYGTQPTIIDGNFNLCVPDTVSGHATLEGIYHSGTIYYTLYTQRDTKFIKCRLNNLWPGTYTLNSTQYTGTIRDANFLHCKIANEVVCNSNSSMTFINSFVNHPQTRNASTSNFTFHNCVVDASYRSSNGLYSGFSYNDGSYYNVHLYSSIFTNCIIVNTSSNSAYFGAYSTLQNCLIPSGWSFDTSRSSYWTYGKRLDVFKTYDGGFSNAQDFALTDTAKKNYVDAQGREVGIHGGVFPFSARVAGPHLKTMQVAPRSTADGKLNVKVFIENTGY